MCDHQLNQLSISQLGDVLASQGFNQLKTILVENEISGAMLNEIESAEELQSIDSRIKPVKAKGWFEVISNLKTKKISECPICSSAGTNTNSVSTVKVEIEIVHLQTYTGGLILVDQTAMESLVKIVGSSISKPCFFCIIGSKTYCIENSSDFAFAYMTAQEFHTGRNKDLVLQLRAVPMAGHDTPTVSPPTAAAPVGKDVNCSPPTTSESLQQRKSPRSKIPIRIQPARAKPNKTTAFKVNTTRTPVKRSRSSHRPTVDSVTPGGELMQVLHKVLQLYSVFFRDQLFTCEKVLIETLQTTRDATLKDIEQAIKKLEILDDIKFNRYAFKYANKGPAYFSYKEMGESSEADYQDTFDKTNDESSYFYTGSHKSCMFYHMLPDHEHFCSSAKPGVISTLSPVLCEIKCGRDSVKVDSLVLDAIRQCLERIDVAARMYGTIGNLYTFAMSGCGGYLLHFQRCTNKSMQCRGHINIHFLGQNDKLTNFLWRAITVQGIPRRDHFFLAEDSVVCKLLDHLGYDRCAARVNLIGFSQSKVFAITLPKKVTLTSNSVWAVAANQMDLVVKVINRNSEFRREAEISRAIAEAMTAKYPGMCHILGFVTEKGVEWPAGRCPHFQALDEINRESLRITRTVSLYMSNTEQGIETVDACWQGFEPITRGGGVIMIPGEPLGRLTRDLLWTVSEHLHDELTILEELGFCQRDIRRPNVIRLNGRFKLVDYGLAVKSGTKVTIDEVQFKNCGRRVVLAAMQCGRVVSCTVPGHEGKSVEQLRLLLQANQIRITSAQCQLVTQRYILDAYEWTPADDREMLGVMMERLDKEIQEGK